MIGLEDEEEEDEGVEFCAYASRGAAFNATVVSPVIATTTIPSVKNVGIDTAVLFCLSMT
jgi:hypothetical protein